MIEQSPAQPDGQERRRDAVGEVVVEASEPEAHDLVRLEAQPPCGRDVDADRGRAEHLELGVQGEGQQVVDRARGAQVAAVVVIGERAAAGHTVDQPVGHEVLEGAPHGLAADAMHLAQLRLGRQRLPGRVAMLGDVGPQPVSHGAVRRRSSAIAPASAIRCCRGRGRRRRSSGHGRTFKTSRHRPGNRSWSSRAGTIDSRCRAVRGSIRQMAGQWG